MSVPQSDPANITEERAARRFHQIRRIDNAIQKVDRRIADVKETLNTLKEERDGYLADLRTAARDEGPLPLFEDA